MLHNIIVELSCNNVCDLEKKRYGGKVRENRVVPIPIPVQCASLKCLFLLLVTKPMSETVYVWGNRKKFTCIFNQCEKQKCIEYVSSNWKLLLWRKSLFP